MTKTRAKIFHSLQSYVRAIWVNTRKRKNGFAVFESNLISFHIILVKSHMLIPEMRD